MLLFFLNVVFFLLLLLILILILVWGDFLFLLFTSILFVVLVVLVAVFTLMLLSVILIFALLGVEFLLIGVLSSFAVNLILLIVVVLFTSSFGDGGHQELVFHDWALFNIFMIFLLNNVAILIVDLLSILLWCRIVVASTFTTVVLFLKCKRIDAKDISAYDEKVVLVDAVVLIWLRTEGLVFKAIIELPKLFVRVTAMIEH